MGSFRVYLDPLPKGVLLNMPIGTNWHVQKGPFWRRATLYSEGHHCVEHGLHYNIFVGLLNLDDPDKVRLSILSTPAKRAPFEHAD